MSPRMGLTCERVTVAAAELADETGFANVTVSALARRLGVKDASIYSHVRNLRDLRVRVGVLATEEISDRIAPAVAGLSGHRALAAFASAIRGYARDHPGRYAATQLRAEPAEWGDAAGPRRAGELTLALLRGYDLQEPDATDAVRLLRSTVYGFIDIELTEGFAHPRELDASWERILLALHHTFTDWKNHESTD